MIKIKIKDIELTLDEAREMFDELGKLFAYPSQQPILPILPNIPFQPAFPYPPYNPTAPSIGYPPIVTYTSNTFEFGKQPE